MIKDIIRKLRVKTLHCIANIRADSITDNSADSNADSSTDSSTDSNANSNVNSIKPGTSLLIIAPHPDDEVIGCAGLILHSLDKGNDVYIIILTGGEASHNGCCEIPPQELITARRELAVNINRELGIPAANLFLLDYPDGKINYSHYETDKLSRLIKNIRPDAIFIPHKGEGWSDHIQAGNIIKRMTEEMTDIRLYEYCVWFWYYNTWKIDWKNALLLNMTKEEHLRKKEAIDRYISPLAPCGKPWSGGLPKVFIEANYWKKELYFKIK